MTMAAVQEINQNLLTVIKNKPEIHSVNDLYDWKEDVWEKQYNIDYRIRELFQNHLDTDEQDVLFETILYNPYIPHVPYFTQIKLLTEAMHEEFILYGGGRGGGKTDAELMAGVQFADFPEWQAGILRLTYKHLSRLGAILDRAKKWFNQPYLDREGIKPEGPGENSIFKFPSGAGLMFGHVQHDSAVEIYQGSELLRLELDEAVQFSTFKITGLKGSIRKSKSNPLPMGVIYTGNPGGLSHDYFNNAFVKGPHLFIPSLFRDNPHLDHDKYELFLDDIAKENPILGLQWKDGDWNAVPEGKMFKRSWFRHTYWHIPERVVKRVRLWDLASTDPEDPNKSNKDPDYTAGCLLLLGESGRAYLEDMQHFRKNADIAEDNIFKIAKKDTPAVKFRFELEGGSTPQYLMNIWSKRLVGYDFDGWRVPRKDKTIRAQAMVSFIKHGNLWIKEDADWNDEFLAEITSFPTKKVHDDQVDALSGAFSVLFNLKNEDYDEPDWEEFEEYNDYD